MELELGLKITKLRDDLTSTDFWIAKDSAGLLFLSSETDTMFILTAHLKGFRREKIKIDINEDGTRIAVCGEKPVQEMVMVGWMMHNKEVELWAFKKVFLIPDGVILDRIKAKFNEERAILTIHMPKSVKGIRGVGIEEVREKEVAESAGSEMKKLPVTQEIETSLDHELEKQEVKVGEEMDKVMEKSPEVPEIGREKQSEETITEKVNPAPATTTTTTYQETEIAKQKEVEQERKFEKPEQTEQPKTEETCVAELSDLIEKVKKEKTLQAERDNPEEGSKVLVRDSKTDESTKEVEQVSKQAEIPSVQQAKVEEENTEGQIPPVEIQMQKQSSEKREIQEQVEAKPNQGTEQETPLPDLPVDQENKNEAANRQEEIHGIGDEIQEEKTNQVELSKEKDIENHESSQATKQEDLSDKATKIEKPASEKSKLFAPCFYAGSAFLVTLIVFVVHLVRAKKR